MSFATDLKLKEDLEKHWGEKSKKLNYFPRLENGLVPDAIKKTEEWKTAKRECCEAFGAYRNFNKIFLKKWAKQYSYHNQAKRSQLIER